MVKPKNNPKLYFCGSTIRPLELRARAWELQACVRGVGRFGREDFLALLRAADAEAALGLELRQPVAYVAARPEGGGGGGWRGGGGGSGFGCWR